MNFNIRDTRYIFIILSVPVLFQTTKFGFYKTIYISILPKLAFPLRTMSASSHKRRRVSSVSDDDEVCSDDEIHSDYPDPNINDSFRAANSISTAPNISNIVIDLKYLTSEQVDVDNLDKLTPGQACDVLNTIHGECKTIINSDDLPHHYKAFFGISDIKITQVDVIIAKYMCGVMILYQLFMKKQWAGFYNETTEKAHNQFKYIFSTIKTGEKCLQVCKQQNELAAIGVTGEINLFDYAMPDPETQTDWQKLLLFCLQKLATKGWRRYNSACYEEVVIYHMEDYDENQFFIEQTKFNNGDDNYQHCTIRQSIKSCAWKHVCDIDDLVHKLVNRNQYFEQWLLLTSQQSNAKATTRYLALCDDYQFVDLKPNRLIRTFNNGVLVFDFGKEAFYPFRHVNSLPSNIVSCKYIPLDFDVRYWNMKHWYNIPTPVIQHIFDSQKLTPQVSAIIYGMLGRLLYPLGKHDNWQVILFLKGVANSGKSTIGKVVKMFFDIAQVAVLSSNAEDKFGLEPLLNHLVWICFEVTKSWSISRCDFQSMVSGEDISAARKNKVAQQITWDIPGLLLGNEMGPWLDAAGSIVRRLLVCKFQTTITEVDNDLDRKLFNELPMIIYKCQSAYVSMVQEYKKDGIWERVPRYFRKVQKDISINTNPIKAFLCESPFLVRSPNAMMPIYVFTTQFKEYAKGNQTRVNFTTDEYKSVFDQEGIEMVQGNYEWDGRIWGGRWIKGICLMDKSPENAVDTQPIEDPDDDDGYVTPPPELCSLSSHIWKNIGVDTQMYYTSAATATAPDVVPDTPVVVTTVRNDDVVHMRSIPAEEIGFRESDVLSQGECT